MRFEIACVVMVAVVSVGCGGDDVPADQFPLRVAESMCQRDARCGAFASQSACMAPVHDALANAGKNVAAGVGDGTIHYDAGQAGACLDALANEGCDPTTMDRRIEPTACKNVVKGTVADGGACKASEQCVSGKCNISTCTMACCPGTCDATKPAPAAIGQSCTAGPCNDDAYCNNGTCTALLASGMTCTADNQCTFGTACLGTFSSKSCGALPKLGEACVQRVTMTCITTGLTCDPATSKCVAMLDSGATCSTTMPPACKLELMCDGATSSCSAPPAIGSSCSAVCATGAYCDAASMTCIATKADGTACVRDEECSSAHCEPSTKMCAPYVGCA